MFSGNDMVKWITDYTAAQDELLTVRIVIKNGENELPPLDLLRAQAEETNVDTNLILAQKFVVGKEVGFYDEDDTEIFRFTCLPRTPLQNYFVEKPWLLDLLLGTCRGLLLKKLTPPSKGSTVLETSSAVEE